mmetsp:Transcript_126495/g.269819  ORF Transcript_126495/g.269819 Transcript_126495/m.269819 type:complete len:327 (-) Transcript_126495:32-1012(-)
MRWHPELWVGRPPLALLPPLLLFSALPGPGQVAATVDGPGAGNWAVEAPERHGLDSAAVRVAQKHIFGSISAAERDCFLVVRDGVLIHEAYRPFYNGSAHNGYSMTKTLGALLVGWAQTRGLLDIDADITSAYGIPSPRPYPVTTRQIMSQALAGAHGPGEAWDYDTVGGLWLNHLPQVFRAATGLLPSVVWRDHFQGPLGLGPSFSWPNVDTSWAFGSHGTCRDYARLGQLLLNEGSWRGLDTPMVSSEYVRQMHTPQTRYGSPSDVYLAAGIAGQETMVVPDYSLVIVSMGRTAFDYPVERVVYEGVCKMFPCHAAEEGQHHFV